jgi:hypothetical protein
MIFLNINKKKKQESQKDRVAGLFALLRTVTQDTATACLFIEEHLQRRKKLS